MARAFGAFSQRSNEERIHAERFKFVTRGIAAFNQLFVIK